MKTNNLGKQINCLGVTEMNLHEVNTIIEQYAKKNNEQWYKLGQDLRSERKKLGLTLYQIGKLLGTSASRISNLENGKSVTMAKQLITSYKLVLEYERLKKKNITSKARLINRIITSL